MILELRKETKPDGNMYYEVWQDDGILKSFWIGNHVTGEEGCYGNATGNKAALAKAKEYYDLIKINATSAPVTEIILSEII